MGSLRWLLGRDHFDQTLRSTVAHHRIAVSQSLDLIAGDRSHSRLGRTSRVRFGLASRTAGRHRSPCLSHLNGR